MERFTIDSVVSVDEFDGSGVSNRPQIIIDVSAGVRLGDHWQAFFRPWLRQPRPNIAGAAVPPWDTELYQAGVRYEKPGPIGTRVDLGYIPSPIGLGMLDARANVNPTIAGHVSYFVPMPPFEPTGPRASAIASTYPLGASAMFSASTWDVRAALVNSSPTRGYEIGNTTNPQQTPNVVVGGGVTPTIGLRLGAAFARGAYASRDEVADAAGSRNATIVAGEGEYSFRYTLIRGEMVRTTFETAAADAVAYEWFVQAAQTLTPRWFAAARHEGTSAPPARTATSVGERTQFRAAEVTIGFRVTPELTLRGSYYTRRAFTAAAWDNQAGASIVWARRWW